MSLIEYHPQAVLETFRRGEFDQIEIIGQADEKEVFELCFKEKILDALAKEMPTDRKKRGGAALVRVGSQSEFKAAHGKFLQVL